MSYKQFCNSLADALEQFVNTEKFNHDFGLCGVLTHLQSPDDGFGSVSYFREFVGARAKCATEENINRLQEAIDRVCSNGYCYLPDALGYKVKATCPKVRHKRRIKWLRAEARKEQA